MMHGGMRRQDTTKGPPLRILSLGAFTALDRIKCGLTFIIDGGGVRGYSMLILLQELMHRTFVDIYGRAPKRNEIPRPCDHFDLIAGTGTGGLIAIMLGRLRMDIDTCMNVYVRMTKKVFETDKTIAGIPYRSTLFKASKLEEAIRQCVREHTVSQDEGNDDFAGDDASSPLGSPINSSSGVYGVYGGPQRSLSNASGISSPYAPSVARSSYEGAGWGNSNTLLYDSRENRTKTYVGFIGHA